MCQGDRATVEPKRSGDSDPTSGKTNGLDHNHTGREVPGESMKRIVPAILEMSQHILSSAWNGQRLPQLTLIWAAQIIHHVILLINTEASDKIVIRKFTENMLLLTTAILLPGYILLIFIYRHSVQTIFNRKLPPTLLQSLPSFGAHLALLKPLQVIYRRLTAPIRVLPDLLVLGEVRCGTTSLCHHLSALPGAQAPFCLWKHPELDRKETFYFVGHYLGNVKPRGYRMCFPLKLTQWIHTLVLGKPFFTFDGCAQYLTSPTAPYLIARAYKEAGIPPPILVVCIRNPVEQGTSWWNYEHHAMQWGSSMGLTEWNTELRGKLPLTLTDVLDDAPRVNLLYDTAEQLFQQDDSDMEYILPPWAMTWPGGQLTGVLRNGAFWSNINRYETVFNNVFGKRQNASASLVPSSSKLSHVNVVPLEFLQDPTQLSLTLSSLMQQVNTRQASVPAVVMNGHRVSDIVHRNASDKLLGMEATHAEERRLVDLFSSDTQELEVQCGIKLGWKVN